MEELFLSPFLSDQKLDVIDHQHIDVSVALSEVHHFIVADRVNDLVCELFGREIRDS